MGHSIAGLIAALTPPDPDQALPSLGIFLLWESNYKLFKLPFHHQMRLEELAKDKCELGRRPGLGTGHNCSAPDPAT